MREPATLSRRAIASAIPFAVLATAPAAALPAFASPGAHEPWSTSAGAGCPRSKPSKPRAGPTARRLSTDEAQAHDAIGDELYEVTSALFDEITRTPATTAAGLAAKARVLAHENDLERLDEASIAEALGSARYLVDRAALSLVLDILWLAKTAS